MHRRPTCARDFASTVRLLAGLLCLCVAAAGSAQAVVIASGDGSGNTDDPRNDVLCSGGSPPYYCDFPHWERLLEIDVPSNACSFVYLGDGWIASADHSPCNDELNVLRFVESGAAVDIVPGTFLELENLELFVARVQPLVGEPALPALPFLPIVASPLFLFEEVLMIGRGLSRGTPIGPPTCGWNTTSPYITRWGTNQVQSASPQLVTSFDCSCGGGGLTTEHEANAANGDSGGPIFRREFGSGEWQLAGVIWGSNLFGACTGITVGSELSLYRDAILSHTGGGADTDGDGISDGSDNCILLANPSQFDADGDGYGNRCDPDFDQNNLVGGTDYGAFKQCLGKAVPTTGGAPADPTCIESDMDANGTVGGTDWGILRSWFAQPPGPSGLACADPTASVPVCP